MALPLLRLLLLGYGLAALAGISVIAAGSPIWMGVLTFWIGGAVMVILIGALITWQRHISDAVASTFPNPKYATARPD